MADKNLKPCPFCGATENGTVPADTVKVIFNEKADFGKGAYQVICYGCLTNGHVYHHKQRAINAWNKRV